MKNVLKTLGGASVLLMMAAAPVYAQAEPAPAPAVQQEAPVATDQEQTVEVEGAGATAPVQPAPPLSVNTDMISSDVQPAVADDAAQDAVIDPHAAAADATAVAVDAAAAADAAHGEAAHGDAHHGSKGLPQFDPTYYPSQIFWIVATFILMYMVFARKSLPEISRVLESRRQHIENDLSTAERLRAEAQGVFDAYELGMQNARAEAAKIYAETERKIQETITKSVNEFQERSLAEIEKTERKIQSAKAACMDEMADIAAEAAALAAQKVVGIQADVKKAKSAVQSLAGSKQKAA